MRKLSACGKGRLADLPPDPPTPEGSDPWMTRAEVAAYAKVSVRTVDRWVRAGRLRSVQSDPHGTRRSRRSWVDRFLSGGQVLAVALTSPALLGWLMMLAVASTVLLCSCGMVGGEDLPPLLRHICPR